jgi:inosine/xanthosine triphosphatase
LLAKINNLLENWSPAIIIRIRGLLTVMSALSSSSPRKFNVAVGSGNPAKVESVRLAMQDAFPDAELTMFPFAVASGVSDQPIGEEETRRGAGNRAVGARDAYAKEHGGAAPDFAVGLEGGCGPEGTSKSPGGHPLLSCFAYMAICGATQAAGAEPSFSRTASFTLPYKVTDLMQAEGLELGDADDKIFSRVNSKQGAGTVGILTNMIIDRAQYYRHALAFALVPFMDHNQWLYADDDGGKGIATAAGASPGSPVHLET